ncbi:hypothetical protein EST38_g8350 [Candolleomyces aberdarensis]|uniref:Nephrocystin 3-like N-terminal domain-containing protein n=1 Tax=Candolleomyces aberdarensis TaxID=2316362 RepID=A0A4Q2DEW0_9AGAR|nr:hypothetical protein EST38_g8350 [Candolleomyces aberdarensis]
MRTRNTRRKRRYPRPYPDPWGSRRGGRQVHDVWITNERAESGAEQMVEPMLPAPVEPTLPAPPIGQLPLTNPNTVDPSPSQSFFEGAQHFRMRDFQYFNANHVTVNPPPVFEPFHGWMLLIENISPNALHNSYARYDAPKCDEGTRVEAIGELMDWIEDRDGPQRLLCMTGAAGSGKSSLQQTIAERCAESGILGSAYCFSSTDPTRNTTSTFVPTIAFQLGSRNPDLKQAISTVVREDPVIFKKSLQTQMNGLLVRPLKRLQKYTGLDLATFPYAVLIDSLDECEGEDRQIELFTAIRDCLLTSDLPFRIFIASRPEWAIRTALEPGGPLHGVAYHILLSDQYDATGDMCRYLQRRFEQLSVRAGNPHWFTKRDIETLVESGSGQFIYAATVYRYISARRASPAERLKIVLTWTSHEGQKALADAAYLLPIFWTTESASIDDEIINFSQNGGWQKIDSVHVQYKAHYSSLSNKFGPLTKGLKKRNPAVVAVMSTFFNKWSREYEQKKKFLQSQQDFEERRLVISRRVAMV